ncbi:MAG: hypothetical protein GXY61_06445 [Lentisphaerae bacterium]|jgi:hypothetical protein|nr:hypothetical protein [Lentisphaerota bacterium]
MKTVLMALMIVAGSATTLYARLGETVEACEVRYGKPITLKLDDQKTGIAVYDKNDLTIEVHFSKGSVDLIRYSPGVVQAINLKIAQELLERNGRDKKWVLLTETEVTINDIRDERAQYPRVEIVDPILWQSKDKILLASYSDSKKSLEIKAADLDEKIIIDL